MGGGGRRFNKRLDRAAKCGVPQGTVVWHNSSNNHLMTNMLSVQYLILELQQAESQLVRAFMTVGIEDGRSAVS